LTVAVWRIATDTPAYVAEDMTGAGAKATGGRWNRVGTAVVYCASSIALACLETVVHLNAGALPLNRYLVRIDIPDRIWAKAMIRRAETAPVGWDATPPGKVSLDFGEDWIVRNKTALLVVPSIIVPEEANVLINPGHSDAARIVARKIRRWQYDPRMS
jgi:RES domain-containing protein